MSPPSPEVAVEVGGPLVGARFVARPNRFLVRATLVDGGKAVEAHLPDPGRLRELLLPDARLLLRPATPSPTRRTSWSAALVETPGGEGWVSLDTSLPNRLVRRALETGALDELRGRGLEKAEWTHGASRFDFLLADASGARTVLEVKSVTLVEDGEALFPDAVTARGARHVRELAGLVNREGWAAAVLFVLQRDDALRIRAAASIDPDFAEALAEARDAGVRVLGRRCRVTPDRVVLGSPVPVV